MSSETSPKLPIDKSKGVWIDGDEELHYHAITQAYNNWSLSSEHTQRYIMNAVAAIFHFQLIQQSLQKSTSTPISFGTTPKEGLIFGKTVEGVGGGVEVVGSGVKKIGEGVHMVGDGVGIIGRSFENAANDLSSSFLGNLVVKGGLGAMGIVIQGVGQGGKFLGKGVYVVGEGVKYTGGGVISVGAKIINYFKQA